MNTALKAEFRKLLTVRTTYIITGLVLLFVCFIGFYAQGYRLGIPALKNSTTLASDATGALGLSVFGAIVAILLMTHEYRYNTILHTLTANRSRTTVLLSKIIVVSTYSLVLTAAISVLAPLMSNFGVIAGGNASLFVPQTLHFWDLAWRCLFYGWGWGMAGLLIATLARSQVVAITALFVIPDIIETLLSLWLKKHAVYLPFSALGEVTGSSGHQIGGGALSPAKGALIFTIYIVAGWLIAWALFLSRDAN